MIATKAATAKAEKSTDKRFDEVSENQQLLADRPARNITLSDVERREISMVDKITDLAAQAGTWKAGELGRRIIGGMLWSQSLRGCWRSRLC
jgi:hypothetical protein